MNNGLRVNSRFFLLILIASNFKHKMLKSIVFILTFFLINVKSFSQTTDTKEGLYNIGFGAVFGGVGAVINKNKDEKFLKVLMKGMGQGALGGYIVFESKRLLRGFEKTGNYTYIWPSRLLNSAGNSIMENAASNIDFYDKWNLHIGFNRLEFITKEGFRFNYRFMPFGFVSFIRAATYGKLNASLTLKTGVFVFRKNGFTDIEVNGQTINATGFTMGNSFVISNSAQSIPQIIAHEMIHVYQNDSFIVFNPYLTKTLNKLSVNYRLDKGIFKYVYLDLNNPLFSNAYWVDSKINKTYFKMFFEQEAFYYSGTLF